MIHFFDNCSTTRVDDDVMAVIVDYAQNKYYNPSARSSFSLNVSNDLEKSRSVIAKILGADSSEILFTSGGTESNNIAMLGGVRGRKGNIVLTPSEHSAVYNTANELAARGLELRLSQVGKDGHIDVDDFISKIDENTVLACFMHVNNETGAVNDVKKINSLVKAKNPHTLTFSDGVQAVGKIPVNLRSLGVDLYSCSGHKLHCSKGIGFLYVKKGVKVNPIAYGGGQENGLRSGTEYVGGAVALSVALQKACSAISVNSEKYLQYKSIIRTAMSDVKDCVELCIDEVSPAVMTYAFKNVKGEVLLHMLEKYDIIVGTGSACSSKNKQSRIAKAIKLPREYSEGILRISFSKYNTVDEAQLLGERLAECVSDLRKIMTNTHN